MSQVGQSSRFKGFAVPDFAYIKALPSLSPFCDAYCQIHNGSRFCPYLFLDRARAIRYTIKVLFAARWCSGLTCRPVTAEIVSSNLIRVAIAEVAQW